MWDHQCQASIGKKKDRLCSRKSTWATWCFTFEDQKFKYVTWVETCAWHTHHASGVVSMMKI